MVARGIERRKIFIDEQDYYRFLDTLGRLAGDATEPVEVYGFVLMPNHFHLLVGITHTPLKRFMARMLTSYALYFNRRHDRHGHLFENRYKSMVVEDDNYLLELIRYIHLNPIRGGLLDSLEQLRSWPYSGYTALMDRSCPTWLAADAVLALFSSTAGDARRSLEQFMLDGLSHGTNSELCSRTCITDKAQGPEFADGRTVSWNAFAPAIPSRPQGKSALLEDIDLELDEVVSLVVQRFGITTAELLSPSKRPPIPEARAIIVWIGAKHLGMSGAELSRLLRVSRSVISAVLSKQWIDKVAHILAGQARI